MKRFRRVSQRYRQARGDVGHKISEEERARKENPPVNTTEDVSKDLPPIEEILVKQEWIELCEQRRLPMKQKYQL